MAKRMQEKFKTYGNVFDEFTVRNLFKLSSQGFIEGLDSPLQIGKEANVFTAKNLDDELRIIKIYRLETVDFKGMYDYIRKDPRYINIRRSRRHIIFAWTQREFRNLLKAREGGVKVPTPYTFKDNIIVMEMIGPPAPQLKDATPKNPERFLSLIIEEMRKLWKAELVHGDLSQFNILNWKETPFLIDFSQSTTIKSPASTELLKRDVKNIRGFFNKLGVEIDPREMIRKIVGE